MAESTSVTYGSTDDVQAAEMHKFLRADIIDDSTASQSSMDSSTTAVDDEGVYIYWLYLLVAILLEVTGTTSMKLSDGLTKLAPTVLIYVYYGLAFTVFPLSLKRIDLSTAYAIWSGLGTTLTCLIGCLYFGEAMNLTKAAALVAIIAGCIVLKFAD